MHYDFGIFIVLLFCTGKSHFELKDIILANETKGSCKTQYTNRKNFHLGNFSNKINAPISKSYVQISMFPSGNLPYRRADNELR